MEEIKYIKNENSVFSGLQIRENPDDAFENAIKRGMKHPENWMYMYSKGGRDYFKHCDYRCYKSYPQYGVIDRIKKRIERAR